MDKPDLNKLFKTSFTKTPSSTAKTKIWNIILSKKHKTKTNPFSYFYSFFNTFTMKKPLKIAFAFGVAFIFALTMVGGQASPEKMAKAHLTKSTSHIETLQKLVVTKQASVVLPVALAEGELALTVELEEEILLETVQAVNEMNLALELVNDIEEVSDVEEVLQEAQELNILAVEVLEDVKEAVEEVEDSQDNEINLTEILDEAIEAVEENAEIVEEAVENGAELELDIEPDTEVIELVEGNLGLILDEDGDATLPDAELCGDNKHYQQAVSKVKTAHHKAIQASDAILAAGGNEVVIPELDIPAMIDECEEKEIDESVSDDEDVTFSIFAKAYAQEEPNANLVEAESLLVDAIAKIMEAQSLINVDNREASRIADEAKHLVQKAKSLAKQAKNLDKKNEKEDQAQEREMKKEEKKMSEEKGKDLKHEKEDINKIEKKEVLSKEKNMKKSLIIDNENDESSEEEVEEIETVSKQKGKKK